MDTLPFSGLRVLIIDDSKTIRKSAEVLLRKEGCEVFTAEDGFAALSILGDVNPDVIFVSNLRHFKRQRYVSPHSNCYAVLKGRFF